MEVSLSAMGAVPFWMSCVAIGKPLLLPCGGLTLAGCQLPTRLLYHSHPQQDGAGEESKMRKKTIQIKIKAA